MVCVAVALFLVAAVLGGCGAGGSSSAGGTGGSADASQEGTVSPSEIEHGGTLNISLGEEVTTLDDLKSIAQADYNVSSQINETLYKEMPNGKIGPWLVESATHTPDYKSWTLKLKPGIKFSTGNSLTSDDVAFTLKAGKESETFGSELSALSTVKTPNASTAIVETSTPFPELPLILAQWTFGVLPDNFGGVSEAEFAEHPIGTGPFAFSSWKKGSAITLVKNPYYWVKGLPYVDKVVYTPSEDPNSRVTQVKGGTLNIAAAPPFSEIASLETSPETEITESGLTNGWAIFMNTEKAPFDNQKVREAIDYAFDREAVVKTAGAGLGEPAGSIICPTTYGYDPSIKATPQNIEKAKELVAEAEKEGASTSFEMRAPSEYPFLDTAVQVMQQNFEEAGFKPTITKMAAGQGYANAAKGDYEMWVGPNGEPSGISAEWFAWYNSENGAWTGSPTDETTKMLAEAQRETDPMKRKEDYWKMQKLIYSHKGLIPGTNNPNVLVYGSDLAGVRIGNASVVWVAEAGFKQ
jgi:peptide/nickel transport system substrate-binding protein